MDQLLSTALILKSGILYNVSVSFLIFLVCSFSSLSIIYKTKKSRQNRSFALFLLFLGVFFLIYGLGNFFAWLGSPSYYKNLMFLLKLSTALQAIPLASYLFSNLFDKELFTRRAVGLFSIASGLFYLVSVIDRGNITENYWGIQCQYGLFTAGSYLLFIIFPIAALGSYLAIVKFKRAENLSVTLSIFVYILLEIVLHLAPAADWTLLLYRLAYLMIAAAGYLYFIGEEIKREETPPIGAPLPARPILRVPFFTKLLFLFMFISIIPVTVSSFLMFSTFKEVIDLYVNKPLLWGLKISQQQFIATLLNAQVQTFFLMSITIVLVTVAAILVSSSFAQSLKRIGKGMDVISSGDYSFRIKMESDDEIGDLANYFNEMSAEIKKARDLKENWNHLLDSEVKKKTEQLRIAYDQLISQDKIKTEFISMISHELRTPLTNIENFTSLMLDGVSGALNEDQEASFAAIRAINQKELALVNRLLNFSDLESGKYFVAKEPQSMHQIIQGGLHTLRDKIKEKGIKVSLTLKAQNNKFIGDKEKMIYALQDIIDNAIKTSSEVKIETVNEKDQLLVTVSDNGAGIAKDKLENIFDKFHQIESKGLGLAVAREIINAHDGKIWAESAGIGQGTSIKLTLPLIFG